MIVSCEKCQKKFNIQANLIPDEGRILQCGSCNHKWFFKKSENKISFKNEISDTLSENVQLDNGNFNIDLSSKENEEKKNYEESIKKPEIKKNPKIIKNSLVVIISILALIVLLDTFKYQLDNYIPGLDSILNNLYESLKDLSLFFRDLID